MPEIVGGNKKPPENGLFGDGGEVAARGPGRPKGALNRRSRDWQAWVAASGKKHPLEFLLEVVSADPDELRERFGKVELIAEDGSVREIAALGPKDVLAAQIRAAEAALPYLEQKLPTAVEDVTEGKRMVVVVGQMTPAQQGQVQQRFGWALRPQQNQQVIDAQPAQSDAKQSDDAPKALTTQQE